jgi:hypothetical protein
MKGDRVIAVGKAGRINDRPVLFAKSIGELYPVGDVGAVAAQPSQVRQERSARGAAASEGRKSTADSSATRPDVDPPDTRTGDDVVVWFESDNLGTDRYGVFDRDFVWFTDDPWYPTGNPADTLTWNDNWEKPHWDVWGYDDADEWGLWDW